MNRVLYGVLIVLLLGCGSLWLATDHYAKYLEADNLIDDAVGMELADELVFTRARALSVTGTLKKCSPT